MKKVLLAILIISNTCYSQVSYVVQGANKYQAFGLSTDTKPPNPPNNCMFTEINTGKTYKAVAGAWQLLGIGVDSIATLLAFKTDSVATALATYTQSRINDTAAAIRTTVNGKQASGNYASGVTNTGNDAVNTLYSGLEGTKQNNITLTTIGTGAATLISSVLNIPTPAAGSSPTLILLAANFSNSTVTQLPVTGWTIPVVSGKTYRIEINVAYQTAATGTGGTLGYYMLTGSGTIRGFIQGGISQLAVATSLEIPVRTVTTIGAAGSSLTTTAVSVINSPHSFYSVTSFTCTASGNLQIGWASEVAASAAQLNANSLLIYQALN